MKKTEAAIWIVAIVGFWVCMTALVVRDYRIHEKALENGYTQVGQVGKDTPIWKAPACCKGVAP